MGQAKSNTKEKGWKHLSEKERYKIEALYQKRCSAAEIAAALEPKRDRRTIEREIARGLTLQRNSDLTEKLVYLVDAGQRRHDEAASNKGRGLKIGHDHKPAKYIELKIKEERWSPDAVTGHIKAEGLRFETSLCTKTLYNYIDKEIFAGISNKDLWVKKDETKRNYRRQPNVTGNIWWAIKLAIFSSDHIT